MTIHRGGKWVCSDHNSTHNRFRQRKGGNTTELGAATKQQGTGVDQLRAWGCDVPTNTEQAADKSHAIYMDIIPGLHNYMRQIQGAHTAHYFESGSSKNGEKAF